MPLTSHPSRGDVVRVRLDPVEGSEQGGLRPAIVVSPDLINQHSPVVLVASVTSKKTERIYPFEVLVEPPEGGLSMRSKVMLMHLRSIDQARLAGRIGTLSADTMHRIDEAIRIATGLVRL